MRRSSIQGAVSAACLLLLAILAVVSAGNQAHASVLSQKNHNVAIQYAPVTVEDITAIMLKLPPGWTNHGWHLHHLAHMRHLAVMGLQAHAPSRGGGSYGHPNFCGDGDGDGWDVPCNTRHSSAPIVHHSVSSRAQLTSNTGGTVRPTSSFQTCVIARESGGNSQVMNSSGHYGLYQFSFSTWTAHGGSASLFGHASASYQTQIFWATVRVDGGSDWTPYDGCAF